MVEVLKVVAWSIWCSAMVTVGTAIGLAVA